MWPFKRRVRVNRVPMSPLSSSEEPVSRLNLRIDLAKSFERVDPNETAEDRAGYDGD